MLLFGLFILELAMFPIMWPLAFLAGGVKDLFVCMHCSGLYFECVSGIVFVWEWECKA